MQNGMDLKRIFTLLTCAFAAMFFYYLYIGWDVLYSQDSENYIWGAFELSAGGYFSQTFSGHHPPAYSLFLILVNAVLGKGYIESSVVTCILMNGLLGASFAVYLRALGLEGRSLILAAIICLSNSFLYSHATAGVNAEVLYFPLLLVGLSFYLNKNNEVGPWFYFLFGLLHFVRNIHLHFLPIIFLLEKGDWKRKFFASFLFMLPSLFLQLRNNFYGRQTRELKDSLGLSFNWTLDSKSFEGVWGSLNSGLLTAAILLSTVFIIGRIFFSYRNEARKCLAFFALFTFSFVLIVVATNMFFDPNVSFRERLLLHYYVVAFPLIIYFFTLIVRKSFFKKKYKIIFTISFSILLLLNQWLNYELNKNTIDLIKLSNIKLLIPEEIKSYPANTFIASVESGILRDLYNVSGYSEFFREERISLNYHRVKNAPELPASFDAFLFKLTPYDEDINIDTWAEKLDVCDIRSLYDFKLNYAAGLYLKYSFYKVRELPDFCRLGKGGEDER